MGERGAPPDLLANVRYGQTCNCGRYCDHPDGWTEDRDNNPWDDDKWVDDNEQTPEAEPEPEPSADDSEGFNAGGLVAVGAGVAATGVLVGTLGVVGVPVAAAAFAVGHWLSTK